MTALSQFDRLEAPGLWRATPEAQRQNVVVSLGDATLTVTDTSERPLSHWSLPTVQRLNPGKVPAIYAPSADGDAGETLEIDDDDMIAGIEQVRAVIKRRRPRSGRLRLVLTLGLVALLGTLALTWLPGALVRQTVSVLPDVTRSAVGQKLLIRVRRVAGVPCSAPSGRAALAKLSRRVLGTPAGSVVVLSAGVSHAGHLPGGIILINRALLEDYEEPDVAAGFMLAENERARRDDPMVALLNHAGTIATAKLLTSGKIAESVLDSYAETLLTTPPTPLPDDVLLTRFAEAKVRSTPYAFALDQTGESVLGLIEADPVPVAAAEPLLPDADWISLQGICGG